MSSLKCPKCSSPLETVSYQGITVERCRACAGIWFERCDIEQLKTIKGSETLDIGQSQTNPAGERPQPYCSCPQCREAMMQMLDIDQYAIWYEKCLKCQGVWLDAGEFTQYKQNFSSKGLLHRVRLALGL